MAVEEEKWVLREQELNLQCKDIVGFLFGCAIVVVYFIICITHPTTVVLL